MGYPVFLSFLTGWAPEFLVNAVASWSFLTHFEALSKGVVDLRDVLFFGSVITAFLFMNALILDWKKAA